MNHYLFMKHALQLAEKGKYKTAPNPCVGAVLVHNNTIIAIGYHEEYAKAHAEVNCLLDAIKKGVFHNTLQNSKFSNIRFSNPILQDCLEQNINTKFSQNINIENCILYVTLEPCNHFGKTPPCSHAIVESGIKHVVIGFRDPNPKASGGINYLQEKGVTVEYGILEEECKNLLSDFLIWQNKKRPYCILKMAMSLDGKIGLEKDGIYPISCPASKNKTMQFRQNMAESNGAVLIGANTFLTDNPKLTVRGENVTKQPKAFIVSSSLPSATNYELITARPHDAVFFTAETNQDIINEYSKLGVSLEIIDKNKDNAINLKKVFENAFQNYKCPYIFCEGGAKLAHSLLQEGLVDLLVLYISPKIFADDSAKNVFSGNKLEDITKAYSFKFVHSEFVGDDMHVYLKSENICLPD